MSAKAKTQPTPSRTSSRRWRDSLDYTGFHYAYIQFEGPDLLCLIRTAYRGATSYHNSNRITFHRIVGWRKFIASPSLRDIRSPPCHGAAYPHLLRRSMPHRAESAWVDRAHHTRRALACFAVLEWIGISRHWDSLTRMNFQAVCDL